MIRCQHGGNPTHVGIISTRLAGTDGVSLESEKWVTVLEQQGATCFYFAGELERPPERSYQVDEAYFAHPDIQRIHDLTFGVTTRNRGLTTDIRKLKSHLKDHLYRFIEKFDIGIIVPENALTIPMNLPLGVAITQVIAEMGIETVAHHHDFFWERDRFTVNAIGDYLNMAFPPDLPSIHHTVLNSFQDEQLSYRTGISASIIPNVMDFENHPPPLDDYASDVREALGVGPDELFVLQPTRVVKRKGIEHAIELVKRLGRRAKLVISHAAGDEGQDYEQRLREYSELMQVDTVFVANIIGEKRGTTRDGRKIYTLEDVYPHADLVTYPSTVEGFGNAFLEAIYFKKPIAVNAYSIYTRDIKPKGFSVIELDGYVTTAAVEKARVLLDNPDFRDEMVEKNYRLGVDHYSYAVLRRRLKAFMLEHHWLY